MPDHRDVAAPALEVELLERAVADRADHQEREGRDQAQRGRGVRAFRRADPGMKFTQAATWAAAAGMGRPTK